MILLAEPPADRIRCYYYCWQGHLPADDLYNYSHAITARCLINSVLTALLGHVARQAQWKSQMQKSRSFWNRERLVTHCILCSSAITYRLLIYGLLNDDSSILDYRSTKSNNTINNELQGICKVEVVVYNVVISLTLPGNTEKRHYKPHSGQQQEV
jgi:hypothetical protein